MYGGVVSFSHFFAGIGVGMVRDVSTLMVAQYFKRKRELVEIIVVSASGVGISINSVFINGATRYDASLLPDHFVYTTYTMIDVTKTQSIKTF